MSRSWITRRSRGRGWLNLVEFRSQPSAFDTQNNETGVDKQNVQIARLIVALGEDDSGRRAILRAVAGMQGIVSDKALESREPVRGHD